MPANAEVPPLHQKLARQPGHPPVTIQVISDVAGHREIELRPLYWRHSAFWMFMLVLTIAAACGIFAGEDIVKALRRTKEPRDPQFKQALLLLLVFGIGFLLYAVLSMCRRINLREHADRVEISTKGLIRTKIKSWKRGDGLCEVDAFRSGRGSVEYSLYIFADSKRELAIRGRLEHELVWVCRWLGWHLQIHYVDEILASADRGEFSEE